MECDYYYYYSRRRCREPGAQLIQLCGVATGLNALCEHVERPMSASDTGIVDGERWIQSPLSSVIYIFISHNEL